MEDGSIYDYIGGIQNVMLGADLSVIDALAAARTHNAEKAVCVVKHWCWIDLEAPGIVMQELSEKSQHPVMLLAQSVLFDSLTGQPRDGWVRSAPLVEFADEHIFETRHCLYVLIGHGRRRSMSLSDVVRRFRLSYE